MVRSGRHAAPDNAFGRSAGNAALRGAVLLAIAVVLGIVLLQRADREPFSTRLSSGATSQPAKSTGTTLPVETTTTAVALRAPADVKVLAANGTDVKGLGGRFKDKLSAAGYNALAPTDASGKPVSTSAVYFVTGYEGEAAAIAQLLGIAANEVKPLTAPPPVANAQGANVVVVIGQDKAGSAPASPTTTVVHSTATTVRKAVTTTTVKRAATTTTVKH